MPEPVMPPTIFHMLEKNLGEKIRLILDPAYGFEGTFLLNIIRILIPTLLAYIWGSIPAVLFHDYMGTALTLLWLGLFWKSSYSKILVTNPKTNHIRLSIYNYLDSKKNQRGIQ